MSDHARIIYKYVSVHYLHYLHLIHGFLSKHELNDQPCGLNFRQSPLVQQGSELAADAYAASQSLLKASGMNQHFPCSLLISHCSLTF